METFIVGNKGQVLNVRASPEFAFFLTGRG